MKDRVVLNVPKNELKLFSLINRVYDNKELIKEIKDRNNNKYRKLIDQINMEFENKENLFDLEIKEIFSVAKIEELIKYQKNKSVQDFDKIKHYKSKSLLINPHSPRLIYKTEAKIDLARITIYKRKFKLIQKLKILGFDKLINLLPFREKETENINSKARNLKELESELEAYRINQLKNSPSWKVQNYLKIILIQGNINKQQKYLKWKGSTSIQKLRNYTNYLNRYSYFMNKNKSQFCQLCKINKDLDIIEDLYHFLWNCPAYENNRKIWISELEKNNFSLILNNNNIYNIINKQDSISLLALVDNKTMFESIIRFLNSSLGIRANKRNSKLLP
ncbi:hypothetical protein M0813_00074 [Anaeramoeba flamelloides]|uniref:Reverse transcriptase zinc-binding domain-containing protein n=1 Tax=Anaeramoeba flamelloides TaxID=1746091 RepID=A0ABQ8YWH5_9EUKA|nr:hypothetical protein M0813_00074 [Anaeramoeba flamelloides]